MINQSQPGCGRQAVFYELIWELGISGDDRWWMNREYSLWCVYGIKSIAVYYFRKFSLKTKKYNRNRKKFLYKKKLSEIIESRFEPQEILKCMASLTQKLVSSQGNKAQKLSKIQFSYFYNHSERYYSKKKKHHSSTISNWPKQT